jgi:hypothetical protein
VQNIELEHPEYVAKKQMWRKYYDLYAGGEQLKQNASEYLTRRLKEPLEVYNERLDKVFYENYIGSIIDWYAATLFRREPVIQIEGHNESGRRFFSAFTEDCDLKGTAISDFLRKSIVHALVYGGSYVLVDFPRLSQPAMNRAEEDAAGISRAYLVNFAPDSLTNWSYDEQGQLEWVVLRTESLRKKDIAKDGWIKETKWFYYDRESYRIYARGVAQGETGSINLVDEGRHGLAKQHRVPLFETRVSDGLWLMNKAGLLQLEHFNKSNALGWALTMGLFATPVVYSERDFSQVLNESYYLQLGANDRFGWTEPEGHVYQIAADNLTRLQEEIYRVCYLLNQAGTQSGQVQSGLSKMRDFAITQEVLRAYGDVVKDTIRRVLRAIEAAREDGLRIDVSGLDEFDIGDFSGDLMDAKNLLDLGINSPTLKKQIYKRLAQKYLCDVRQETKDQITREIDDNFGTA